VSAVLVQQVREPQEEARLRAITPSLTSIEDAVSCLADQFVGQALILGGEIEKIPLPFRGGFFPRAFSHQFRQMPVVLRPREFVFHRRPVRQLSHIH
jgi:hypothetical protein